MWNNANITDTWKALPHDEVESSEFYKHIESEGMPEPRRMRQLLMWCGARALGEKPSFEKEDGNARLAGMTSHKPSGSALLSQGQRERYNRSF